MVLVKAIEARNITKIYKPSPVANKDICISVEKGEIFGFLGSNGAGKTTFIRQITTELLPTSGEIFVEGFNVVSEPEKVRPLIGVAPQEYGLYGHLTGREMLRFFAILKKVKIVKEMVNKSLQACDLQQYSNTRIERLSSGLRRRTLLALAIIGEPEILILDEPTVGLDPVSKRSIWEYLLSYKQAGKTIFLTTHDMYEADQLCDRLAIIHHGEIIAKGNPSTLKSFVRGKIKIVINQRVNLPVLEKFGEILRLKEDKTILIISQRDSIPNVVHILVNNDIIDFSINDTSLEEAFIHLTGEMFNA